MESVEHTLMIMGILFIGFNMISCMLIMWFYGSRIIAILRMPASMKEPLVYHATNSTETKQCNVNVGTEDKMFPACRSPISRSEMSDVLI